LLHGGRSTGAPGNKNALKHGVYCKTLLDGEEAIVATVPIGSLDEEIVIAKIRLRRALLAERSQLLQLKHDVKAEREKALELESTEREIADGKTIERTRRRLVDHGAVIHNLVNQIVKLENQRMLLKQGPVPTPEAQARIARELLAKMNHELDAPERAEGE